MLGECSTVVDVYGRTVITVMFYEGYLNVKTKLALTFNGRKKKVHILMSCGR